MFAGSHILDFAYFLGSDSLISFIVASLNRSITLNNTAAPRSPNTFVTVSVLALTTLSRSPQLPKPLPAYWQADVDKAYLTCTKIQIQLIYRYAYNLQKETHVHKSVIVHLAHTSKPDHD